MHRLVRATVRPVVLAVNTPVARRRTNRLVAESGASIKLEIGGLEPRPGWLVTNVSAVTRNYLDASTRWPLADGQAALVYADNVIEHLTLDQGRRLMREAFRCLEPGGVIRLVTPDLRKHIDAYLDGSAAVDGDLAAAYREIGVRIEHAVDLVRTPVENFLHHLGYVYDADALGAELRAAGFTEVRECPVGRSDVPELGGIDRRTDEGPAQMAFEAVRPGTGTR
ncbi:methyltransferase domain-containing protein [Nocardioides albidus]|uniref:Methyltransferase domain-containing protein n=1 Tax=Nocardioides albidus TaxID=1517589 RepID=A0A5C4W7H5_9ACTN|nr:methyltransferase domain-containing protein [Nocardioides albidus]TNM44128.1 methyltransferase domain-containing protein [Nocardioides albidus]